MYYASIGLLALAVHLIINHEYLLRRRVDDDSLAKVRYRHFLYSVTLYYLADICWGFFFDLRIVPLAYADTVLFFLAMVISVLMWTRFAVTFLNRKGRFSKLIIYAGWVIFIYEILNLIVNIFHPIVFKFEKNGDYVPLTARYVTLLMQVGLFALCAVFTLYVTSKTEGKTRLKYLTIGFSGVVMTVFIILQVAYPLLPLYAVGCLIATCLVHEFVAQGQKIDYERAIGSAKYMANTDPLTGVKNAHAYMEAKKSMEQRIMNGTVSEFGVVIFDVNNLKEINDTQGHEQGDYHIKSACNYICRQFKCSPVYRIGGDEFLIILEGEDYVNRQRYMRLFDEKIDNNLKEGLPVVSSGMAIYVADGSDSYDTVFARADKNMYERKKKLKSKNDG